MIWLQNMCKFANHLVLHNESVCTMGMSCRVGEVIKLHDKEERKHAVLAN